MISATLGDHIASRAGTVNPSDFPNEEFELYSIPAHDVGGPEVVPGEKIGSAKQNVQPGDVLLAKIIPHIRRVRTVEPNSGKRQIASGEWIVFRTDAYDPRYLCHFLLSDRFHVQFMNTVAGIGGSLVRARPEFVKKIAAPLPPLDEQRRIAAILDQADAVCARLRTLVEAYDALIDARFEEEFSHTSFPTQTLDDVAQITTGRTPPSSRSGMFGGKIPFVTPGDLDSGAPVVRNVTEEGALASRTVGKGAALVCCIGSVGKVGFAETTVAFNQQINAVKWSGQVDETYGLYALRRMQSVLSAAAGSTTLPLLPKSRFAKIPISIPPISLQARFSAHVHGIRSCRRTAVLQMDASVELLVSLQSRAFNGEL